MTKKKIGIVDLKINNIHSIFEACKEVGYKVEIIDKTHKTYNHDIVILPGIGSFKVGMGKIKEMQFDKKILDFLEKKNKFLVGICLGMQLFFSDSQEFGSTKGLNLIEGKVEKISNKLVVPHTGWNKLELKKNYLLSDKKFNNKMFYFTHSFVCKPKTDNHILAKTKYSSFNFCSLVLKKNIFGMQFHPEKSGKIGLDLIKNFERH